MIDLLKKSRLVVSTVRFFRKLAGITPEMLDNQIYISRQPRLIYEYFNIYRGKPMLQIGCQNQLLAGWLNVDIRPRSESVVYMDATKKFPFDDGCFQCIYSEHMIEHIKFKEAEFMISECSRVLKRGGKIRISTPDFEFLMGLTNNVKTEIQQRYIRFSVQRYLDNETPPEDVYVINNFFRDWGHQFIHNFESLKYLLLKSGFVNIKRQAINTSDNIEFLNLERHGLEISEEFNQLESLIVEAEKP